MLFLISEFTYCKQISSKYNNSAKCNAYKYWKQTAPSQDKTNSITYKTNKYLCILTNKLTNIHTYWLYNLLSVQAGLKPDFIIRPGPPRTLVGCAVGRL